MELTQEIKDAIDNGDYGTIYKYFTSLRNKVLKQKVKSEELLDLIADSQAAVCILTSRNKSLIKQHTDFINKSMVSFANFNLD